MELRNRTTGAVITENEFRCSNSNTSFPYQLTTEIIDSFGYDFVLEGPQPTLVPPYQFSKRDGIEEINGQWFAKYIAVEYDDEAKAGLDAQQAQAVCAERNQRLNACDWTQLPDAPVDATVWAIYRQELRDVTSQAGFPWSINWPQEP